MNTAKGLTGIERIALANITGIYNWEVGGWFNCLQDGCPEYIPDTMQEAKEIIYEESLVDFARPGVYKSGRAPQEMRFAGAAFIKAAIDWLFENDEEGDLQAIAEEKNW